MTNTELAELMFPNITMTIEDYEKKYPERNLPEGAIVSRYAPSPTGFVHMGNMLSCFIENKLPLQSGGAFYLRIEDTDQKREVEGGIENIVNAIKMIGLEYNEGVMAPDKQQGNYGPYIQSERKEIYAAFAKYLVANGMAYPCFCSEEELTEIKEKQMAQKARIGYYGNYAKCRHLNNDERAEKIKQGIPYTIRLMSTGNFEKKFVFKDLVKGKITFPENDLDAVLLKSNGIPVYHFAHVVDDHLMRTTHVLRGEDWLSSVPIHVELFNKFGFKLPHFAHLGLVMIVDSNGNKRKISKRKDTDFTVASYHKKGFPASVLQEYLMTIANTSFEGWRTANPTTSLDEFEFSFSKVGSSPLFDYDKLINISKNCISRMKAVDLYEELANWAKMYDEEFYNVLSKDKDYTVSILNIEREQKKPRKDFDCYSNMKNLMWYMYDEYFNTMDKKYEWQSITDKAEIKKILTDYINNYYDINDDKNAWFDKMKNLAEENGYAGNVKDYKENPSNYKGSITDIATIIRVAVTTSSMTPDLYEILRILGTERIKERINSL